MAARLCLAVGLCAPSAFVRLGIRSFNPKLKTAAARLETLRTPEGEPIPPNTLGALKRDLERHQIVKQQIREIEQTRIEHLAQAPAKGPMTMPIAVEIARRSPCVHLVGR